MKTLVMVILIYVIGAHAQNVDAPPQKMDFQKFLDLAAEKSLDVSAAKSEVKAQEELYKSVRNGQNIPSISLSASYAQYRYDRPYVDSNGLDKSNSGSRTSVGLTVSYDLQKLFSSDSKIANENALSSKMQLELSKRDLVRNIKKSYSAIREIQGEVESLSKMVGLYQRIEDTLNRQKKLGVEVSIEKKQFQIQKNLLDNELQARNIELELAISQLASVSGFDVAELKIILSQLRGDIKLRFGHLGAPSAIPSVVEIDKQFIETLSKDFNLARVEADGYTSVPLPSVYAKTAYENPTMPSAEGPQYFDEVGISIPIDSFFNRSQQKSSLVAKKQKAQLQLEKALSDSRNQLRINIMNLNQSVSQSPNLNKTLEAAEDLLNRSFLYYSQKRIDVLGAMDIFQKYLQAKKNVLLNRQQIESVDAEIEYFVGKE